MNFPATATASWRPVRRLSQTEDNLHCGCGTFCPARERVGPLGEQAEKGQAVWNSLRGKAPAGDRPLAARWSARDRFSAGGRRSPSPAASMRAGGARWRKIAQEVGRLCPQQRLPPRRRTKSARRSPRFEEKPSAKEGEASVLQNDIQHHEGKRPPHQARAGNRPPPPHRIWRGAKSRRKRRA